MQVELVVNVGIAIADSFLWLHSNLNRATSGYFIAKPQKLDCLLTKIQSTSATEFQYLFYVCECVPLKMEEKNSRINI